MAEALGALFVDLGANSAAFVQDMGKARAALSSSGAQINRVLATMDKGFGSVSRSVTANVGSLLNMRTAISTLAGTAGLGLLVKRSLDVADATVKAADTIGITTDALQEYRFAADLAGVSQEQLDTGFKQFAKRLGEARLGTGGLAEFLANFDRELLKNVQSARSTTEALDLVFAAIGRTGDQATRAALASAAFGRSGIELAQIAKDGAVALDEMRAKARALGLVIDESLLRNAEKAQDQLSILGRVIQTQVTVAVIQAAPAIGRLGEAFANSIPKLAAWVTEYARLQGWIEKTPVEKIAELQARLDALRPPDLTPGQAGITFGAAGTEGEIKRLQGELSDAFRELEQAQAPRPTVPSPAGPVGFTQTEFDKIKKAIDDARFKEGEHRQEIEKSTQQLRLQATQFDQLAGALGRNKTEYERLKVEVELENEATRRNINLASEQGQAWAEAFRQSQTAARGFDEVKRAQDGIAESAKAAGDAFGTFAGDFISGARSAGDAARRLLADLVALSVRKSIAEPVSDFFASGLKSAFAGFRAGGGEVQAGRAFIVGERRPEVFVPDRPGTIVPSVAQAFGGRATVNYYVDARGAELGVEQRIMAVLREINNSIEPRAIAAVAFDRQVGGATARPLGG